MVAVAICVLDGRPVATPQPAPTCPCGAHETVRTKQRPEYTVLLRGRDERTQ